jgi:thiol-disulfide isomerase/thioredoxin
MYIIILFAAMNKNLKNTTLATRLFALIWFMVLFPISTQAQDAIITIHLRGVHESKISLLPLSGSNALKPISKVDVVKNGETTTLQVPEDNLPGEFVLRFDYKENAASTPYPSEKRIIIYNQNLNLWVHPIYCNNADSTWFQKDERENTTYVRFLQESARQKAMLGLLQDFLLNYDDTQSSFYKQGITEYEKKRNACNLWIAEQTKQNEGLFVSSMFGFQHVSQINWKGSEADRKQSLRDNYFDVMDFSDPLMLKTTGMKEWMDGYVNLYGELATSVTLRDSLFTLAGKTAIEKARKGNPLVYGWIVDYFFKGYESFNIEKGITMLEPYLDDPNCLTTKRQEINRRLQGIETLVPGTVAPDIIMQDADNKPFELNAYRPGKNYILILFWSADCNHCKETVGKLYPWHQQTVVRKILDIVAISLDETGNEMQAWQQKIKELKGWIHLRAAEGLRSKVAGDYYILGIPVMILLNAKTKEIIALPESTEQLGKLLNL